jgi:hypothetical protein
MHGKVRKIAKAAVSSIDGGLISQKTSFTLRLL